MQTIILERKRNKIFYLPDDSDNDSDIDYESEPEINITTYEHSLNMNNLEENINFSTILYRLLIFSINMISFSQLFNIYKICHNYQKKK